MNVRRIGFSRIFIREASVTAVMCGVGMNEDLHPDRSEIASSISPESYLVSSINAEVGRCVERAVTMD